MQQTVQNFLSTIMVRKPWRQKQFGGEQNLSEYDLLSWQILHFKLLKKDHYRLAALECKFVFPKISK